MGLSKYSKSKSLKKASKTPQKAHLSTLKPHTQSVQDELPHSSITRTRAAQLLKKYSSLLGSTIISSPPKRKSAGSQLSSSKTPNTLQKRNTPESSKINLSESAKKLSDLLSVIQKKRKSNHIKNASLKKCMRKKPCKKSQQGLALGEDELLSSNYDDHEDDLYDKDSSKGGEKQLSKPLPSPRNSLMHTPQSHLEETPVIEDNIVPPIPEGLDDIHEEHCICFNIENFGTDFTTGTDVVKILLRNSKVQSRMDTEDEILWCHFIQSGKKIVSKEAI